MVLGIEFNGLVQWFLGIQFSCRIRIQNIRDNSPIKLSIFQQTNPSASLTVARSILSIWYRNATHHELKPWLKLQTERSGLKNKFFGEVRIFEFYFAQSKIRKQEHRFGSENEKCNPPLFFSISSAWKPHQKTEKICLSSTSSRTKKWLAEPEDFGGYIKHITINLQLCLVIRCNVSYTQDACCYFSRCFDSISLP